jgi:hypothetical protein
MEVAAMGRIERAAQQPDPQAAGDGAGRAKPKGPGGIRGASGRCRGRHI